MRLLKEIRTLLGNYHLKSGIYHYYRNEFKQAADFLRKALKDQARMTEGELRTARYYLTQTFVSSALKREQQEDLEGASADYVRALEVSPDFPDIRFMHGQVLESMDKPEDAIAEYRRATRCNPRYLEAWISQAFCLLAAGRHDEAAAAFSEAVELRLDKIRVPAKLGLDHLQTGDVQEAEIAFHEAFRSSPARFEEYYKTALDRLKAEDYEPALEELDHALELCPNFADLHNFRGVALCELERIDEGIEAFRESVSLNPKYQFPRLNLAFALLRAGEFKGAEIELEAVLEQDPTQHAASVKLDELRTGRVTDIRRAVPRGGMTP